MTPAPTIPLPATNCFKISSRLAVGSRLESAARRFLLPVWILIGLILGAMMVQDCEAQTNYPASTYISATKTATVTFSGVTAGVWQVDCDTAVIPTNYAQRFTTNNNSLLVPAIWSASGVYCTNATAGSTNTFSFIVPTNAVADGNFRLRRVGT